MSKIRNSKQRDPFSWTSLLKENTVLVFENWHFDIVSHFNIRYSDLMTQATDLTEIDNTTVQKFPRYFRDLLLWTTSAI